MSSTLWDAATIVIVRYIHSFVRSLIHLFCVEHENLRIIFIYCRLYLSVWLVGWLVGRLFITNIVWIFLCVLLLCLLQWKWWQMFIMMRWNIRISFQFAWACELECIAEKAWIFRFICLCALASNSRIHQVDKVNNIWNFIRKSEKLFSVLGGGSV